MNASPHERLNGYLATLGAPAPDAPPAFAITISRECGTDAGTIATVLAEQLARLEGPHAPAWSVFDQHLVRQTLSDRRLPSGLAVMMTESVPAGLPDVVEDLLGLHPNASELVRYVSATIHRLARQGRVILIGRGGHIITRSLRHVFHVRLIAPLADRVRRARQLDCFSEPEARRHVARVDRERRRYVRRYFASRVDNPLDYHLVVNVGRQGRAAAADLIAGAFLGWQRSQIGAPTMPGPVRWPMGVE